MIVMAFDLSSVSIGVAFAEIDDDTKKITYGATMTIVPEELDPRDVGYTTKNPKKIAHNGKEFRGYLKEEEFSISHAESKKRSAQLKVEAHNFLLRNIGEQCGRYLDKINPKDIIIERNSSFGGILTTKLLAEIAGGIYFYAGANGNGLYDYNESTVRARIRKDVPDFSYEKDGVKALDTKWEIHCRLRAYFERVHPGVFCFKKMNMDESDSLAVFYYYYVTEVLKHDD